MARGLALVRGQRLWALLLFIFLTFLFFRDRRASKTSHETKGSKSRVSLSENEDNTIPQTGSIQWSNAFEDVLRWDQEPIPPTNIEVHVPGWTIFDRLYVREGIIYIVTDHPELVPHRKFLASKGGRIEPANVNLHQLEATEDDIKIISTVQAKELFESTAIRISGVTFLVNEGPQFLTHMYHFVAELLFGLWRIYSSLDPGLKPNGHTILPPPERMSFPHVDATKWRDYASMNEFILRGAFPSLVMEFSDTWEERAALKGMTFVYDRVVFSDRVAAIHGTQYTSTDRIASEAFKVKASPYWWSTIRMAVLELSKVRKEDDRPKNPVITYVSRQKWGRRMLREEDHLRLVAGLQKLKERYGYEVNIVELDRMSRGDQIRLAARTTIMCGVHGNGLTALLWMKPTKRATVIEFFYPKGFAQDYQWTANALGIAYFGVWNKHIFTSPNLPPHGYPEGFQGNNIPLDAHTVVNLIERRLSMDELDFED
ncbi:hypothetical protein FRC17_005842 [Serendipita sp. 399]|nr:hypothetical protein FRC17_005842 [Serendipita sp. 399]